VAGHVVFDINPKLYTEHQQTVLAQAFRDHGFDVQHAQAARSATDVVNAILIVVAEESTRQSLAFAAAHLHDRWLRSILAETIFRPFSKGADVALTVESGDSSVTVVTANDYGLDQAYDLLSDVESAIQAQGRSDNLKMLYHDGVWHIQTQVDGSIYRYNTDAKSLTRVDKSDLIAPFLDG